MEKPTSRKTDTPTRLSIVAAVDMAAALADVLRELADVDVAAQVESAVFFGALRPGPFKRPSRIRFRLALSASSDKADVAIDRLQALSAQAIADSYAAKLSKLAGEDYVAAPEQVRLFVGDLGSLKQKGLFTALIALREPKM